MRDTIFGIITLVVVMGTFFGPILVMIWIPAVAGFYVLIGAFATGAFFAKYFADEIGKRR